MGFRAAVASCPQAASGSPARAVEVVHSALVVVVVVPPLRHSGVSTTAVVVVVPMRHSSAPQGPPGLPSSAPQGPPWLPAQEAASCAACLADGGYAE